MASRCSDNWAVLIFKSVIKHGFIVDTRRHYIWIYIISYILLSLMIFHNHEFLMNFSFLNAKDCTKYLSRLLRQNCEKVLFSASFHIIAEISNFGCKNFYITAMFPDYLWKYIFHSILWNVLYMLQHLILTKTNFNYNTIVL